MLTFSEWRRAKKISRESLAEHCGVHVNTIIHWEQKPSIIPYSKAMLIAECLGVDIKDIIFLP